MKNLLLLCCFFISRVVFCQDIYIQCGNLIDTKNGKTLTNKTIIVSNKLIKSIEDGFITPTDGTAKVIDLKSKV